jgi:hypothetical protein
LFCNIPFQEQIDNMTDSPVTGFSTPRFFILHTSQKDVDSGSLEWTLGDDGLPPAEPTEKDAGDNDDEDVSGQLKLELAILMVAVLVGHEFLVLERAKSSVNSFVMLSCNAAAPALS